MAISELEYRFRPRSARKADQQVESLIEKAGRDKVFARALALGWVDETPPKWVWQQIAHDIISGRVIA